MSDTQDVQAAIEKLQRENAELNGLILATGVLLTQLLQANTLRELNPQAGATRIVTNAQKAIEAFRPDPAGPLASVMKERALAAVKQYEDQLRSVLPT
jgi:hypothetical protein